MAIAEIALEILGGAIRFVVELLAEVLIEFVIRGPGYLLCRPFSRQADIQSWRVLIAGVLFWLGVAGLAWCAYQRWWQ